ncbi:hypothetical protein D9M73_76460 [compost metagenome]|jgi:hypothetical protein
MKLFIDTRTKRNTAFVVLLVWLFALGSSVANACFLEVHESNNAVKRSAVTTSLLPAGLLAQLGTDAAYHDGSDGTKESCLKVCDDRAHTLPKAYSGGDHLDPGPAPLIATLWTESSDVVSEPLRAEDSAIPTVGPPFRVRYSRLAL